MTPTMIPEARWPIRLPRTPITSVIMGIAYNGHRGAGGYSPQRLASSFVSRPNWIISTRVFNSSFARTGEIPRLAHATRSSLWNR